MSFVNVISLMGGLALFLYGMSVMTNGLEKVSGGRLEATLEKMTGNLFMSILLGTIVTAAIQSSSATTVIAVGLVNAGIMKLRQAIGIIMGANIGTTITAHILCLSEFEGATNFLSYLKPQTLTPIIATIGILLFLIAKNARRREVGQMLLGLSILFTGMFAMEGAVKPLRDAPQFAELFSTLSNPVLGIAAGAIVTVIIQSSSASIGILQALATTGSITFSSAFPIIMGQNIGTCITPVLASMNASRSAKRTAFVHVLFNLAGSFVFLIAMYSFQMVVGLSFWADPINKTGIAMFHSVFNITCTLLFIPFTRLFEKAAYVFIRPSADEISKNEETTLLDTCFLKSPSFAIQHAREVVVKMACLAKENSLSSIEMLTKFDKAKLQKIREQEDIIDQLQSKVDIYLLQVAQNQLSEAENIQLAEVLQIVNEFERIADHADNICDVAENMEENGAKFSAEAYAELSVLCTAISEILDKAVTGYANKDRSLAEHIDPLEEVIDILVETMKTRHSERLQDGDCNLDAAFPFVDILTNLERIADHCSNVGVHIICYSSKQPISRHEYLQELRKNKSDQYRELSEEYSRRFTDYLNAVETVKSYECV